MVKSKEVKEFHYLCTLYNSEYLKSLFRKKGGTLADFERICKVSKNYFFRTWIKSLDILEVVSENGNEVRYVINEGKLKNKIENHPLWAVYKKPSFAIYEGIFRH